MSKPSHRPIREARKEHTQKRRETQRCLRAPKPKPGWCCCAERLQRTPRREANRELSRPAFVATFQELFPETLFIFASDPTPVKRTS
jgi:hypothetical protein